MSSKEDYRTLQSQLDAVLEELQAGDIDIDRAAELYEQGLKLIEGIKAHLAQAENTITKLTADFSGK